MINHTVGTGDSVIYYNGFIWTIYGVHLYRINTTTLDVKAFYLSLDDNIVVCDLIADNNDYIWFSVINNDFIAKFDLLTNTTSLITTGFDRPLGLAIKGDYLYVAENSRTTGVNGTIAKVDRFTGWVIDRLETAIITNEGPYMVYFDSFNNLWWTDNSWHLGVFKSAGENLTYPSIGPYCCYMTQVKNKIWFSCQGSAYIGIVSISVTPVGGLWIPVDKLSLLSPYIALVSAIILAVSISATYIKYRRKQ